MQVALYARKSTLQERADSEAKSVAIQLANARKFAESKGWTVAAEYSDDAVSGAEIKKLVNRQRLIDTIAAGPPFQAVVVRDDSRFSRRDGVDAVAELRDISRAGVEVWFYRHGTRFAYGNFGDNVLSFVSAENNAEYRRKASKDTHEAHTRGVARGHAVGGRCFGYHNMCSACGEIIRVGKVRCCREGHTEQRINDAHKAIVQRIFALSKAGDGFTSIAKQFNAEGVTPRPDARRGVPLVWSPGTIRAILNNRRYLGEVVYNKTTRRAADGSTTYAKRPESEWIRVERPDLRIIDPETWATVHARLDAVAERLDNASRGRTRRLHKRDGQSPYVLSGLLRCGDCGGSVGVLDRRQYGCIAYHKRGTAVCRNALKLPIATLDAAVLQTINREVLRPEVVTAIIDGLVAEFADPARADAVTHQRRRLAALDREIANFVAAIGQGGPLPELLDALKARRDERAFLSATLAAHATLDARRLNRATIERKMRPRLAAWRAKLSGAVPVQRELLREIVIGPITLTPKDRAYAFDGETIAGRLLLGEIDGYQPLVCARGDSTKVATTKFSGIASRAA